MQYDWRITLKKYAFEAGKVGLVAVATYSAALPDSFWGQLIQSIGASPQITFFLTVVGVPAVRAYLNKVKNS